MILLVDNYDSFVANIARYFRRLGHQTVLFRNDELILEDVDRMQPDQICISPGPCTPAESGISVELIKRFAGTIPILGICLGHQAIASAYGGRIVRAPEPYHGRESTLQHAGHPLFRDIPGKFQACRYHSLIIDPVNLPSRLQPLATTTDGIIMAVGDQPRCVYGVQFHPESILTPCGFQLLQNFLDLAQSDGLSRQSQVSSNRLQTTSALAGTRQSGRKLFASETGPRRKEPQNSDGQVADSKSLSPSR